MYLRLDGQTAVQKRQQIVELFNSPYSKHCESFFIYTHRESTFTSLKEVLKVIDTYWWSIYATTWAHQGPSSLNKTDLGWMPSSCSENMECIWSGDDVTLNLQDILVPCDVIVFVIVFADKKFISLLTDWLRRQSQLLLTPNFKKVNYYCLDVAILNVLRKSVNYWLFYQASFAFDLLSSIFVSSCFSAEL